MRCDIALGVANKWDFRSWKHRDAKSPSRKRIGTVHLARLARPWVFLVSKGPGQPASTAEQTQSARTKNANRQRMQWFVLPLTCPERHEEREALSGGYEYDMKSQVPTPLSDAKWILITHREFVKKKTGNWKKHKTGCSDFVHRAHSMQFSGRKLRNCISLCRILAKTHTKKLFPQKHTHSHILQNTMYLNFTLSLKHFTESA